jgi:hypothetical protein
MDFFFKDTKKSITWWCLTAPRSPRAEISIKMIPHARIPPTIGKFVTKEAARPYTATPIRIKATIYKKVLGNTEVPHAFDFYLQYTRRLMQLMHFLNT